MRKRIGLSEIFLIAVTSFSVSGANCESTSNTPSGPAEGGYGSPLNARRLLSLDVNDSGEQDQGEECAGRQRHDHSGTSDGAPQILGLARYSAKCVRAEAPPQDRGRSVAATVVRQNAGLVPAVDVSHCESLSIRIRSIRSLYRSSLARYARNVGPFINL
jgi:hypothetical protein